MRKYGARPRMKCRGCGKDVAQSTTTGSERTHKCPHKKECHGKNACLACHEKMRSSGPIVTGRGVCSTLGPCRFHESGGNAGEACASVARRDAGPVAIKIELQRRGNEWKAFVWGKSAPILRPVPGNVTPSTAAVWRSRAEAEAELPTLLGTPIAVVRVNEPPPSTAMLKDRGAWP